MLRLAVFLVLVLEPLVSLARPQYFCAIPCPLTKPCNPGPSSSGCKYPCNNNNYYDDESYSPCPINLTVNCCSDGGGFGGNGGSGGGGDNQTQPTTTTSTTTSTTTTTTTPPPQSRSGEDMSYRRNGNGRMLTSLFSIPGAVADTFLSGEVTL